MTQFGSRNREPEFVTAVCGLPGGHPIESNEHRALPGRVRVSFAPTADSATEPLQPTLTYLPGQVCDDSVFLDDQPDLEVASISFASSIATFLLNWKSYYE